MSSCNKNIVFAAHPERIPSILPLMRALSLEGYTLFYVYRSDTSKHSFSTHLEILKNLDDITVITLTFPSAYRQKLLSEYSWLRHPLTQKLLDRFLATSLGQLLSQHFMERLFESDYGYLDTRLKDLSLHAIFMITDKYYGDGETALARIGKKRDVPLILLHTFYHGPSIAAFRNNKKFTLTADSSWYQRETFKKFSRPEYGEQTYEEHFFYPAPTLNALHKYGLLTKNPWYIGAGWSDYLIVDHGMTRSRYAAHGTPDSKIVVLGEPSYDTLFEALQHKNELREQLISRYRLNREKPILLMTPPELFGHNLLSKKQHDEEIAFLFQALSAMQHHANILISLHPKSDVTAYRELCAKAGFTLLKEPLVQILPAADLYTSTFSSTIVWAVMAGVKNAVFDFYHLDYTMYDTFTSIVKIRSKSALVPVWEELLRRESADFNDDWNRLARHDVFTGTAMARHLQFIKGLNMHDNPERA